MNQKPQEIGWMYHMAPKSKAEEEPEHYPPPSQIPGLNGEEIEYQQEDNVRGWIKDTDSKYIRLAKQGGRPDLLKFKEDFPKNKEPRGYPRCEWFYMEDNKEEDQAQDVAINDSHYVPRLPDYMVHEAYNNPESPGSSKYRPGRLPYAQDRTSVYERDGRSATDKTVQIPETQKPGFGLRNAHNKDKPVKRMPAPERAKNATRGEARADHIPEDDSAPSMGKLLAGTYEQEWHDRCHKWQHQQEKIKPKLEPKKADPMPHSVYHDTYGPPPQKRDIKHGRRAGTSADAKNRGQYGDSDKDLSREIKRMEKELDTKELFKLSKFKNVPSKLDTHHHPSQKTPNQGLVY